MAIIKPYVDQLKLDRTTLATNIAAKGIPVEENETFTSLSNKVANINKSPFTGHYDAEGLATIGWSDEEIQYYQDNGVQWNAESDNDFKLTATELAGDDSDATRFLPKSSTKKSFGLYYSLLAIPQLDTSSSTNFSGMFTYCYSLTTIPQLDTSSGIEFGGMFGACSSLITIPQLNTSLGTSFSSMFDSCYSLKTIPQLDTSSGTNFDSMFYNCSLLTTIPQLDTSSGANFQGMFNSCRSLKIIPQMDTSSGTNFNNMFYSCRSLKTIPQLNTSLGTSFSSMFCDCYSLTTIPQLNTSLGTSFSSMFNSCRSLKTIPQLNTSSGTDFSNMFSSCNSLTDFGGLKNIGQAYLTTQSANYSNYTLNLSACTKLTHDSLMNVINNLYDIASAGVQPQKLVLGNKNLAKLTAEEKAIATNKGWAVS